MKNLKRTLLFILLSAVSGYSFAQEECTYSLYKANENKYEIGSFYACIDGLKPCVDKNGFEAKNMQAAYVLISKCYLALDSINCAEYYIEKLLRMNDNFTPDENAPQRFTNEVTLIRQKIRSTQISSVSKKNEEIDHAPATIQIITDTDIVNRGYKTLDEIFNDLPGFDVSRTRGVVDAVLYQRGYRTANTTDRTMILVDGVEDNDMWSNGDLVNLQFPLSNVKRIEVIYGPASTIYGANAYAGVINIVTKSEDDLFPKKNTHAVTATGMAGYGSFNTSYGNATVAVRSKKGLFFSVTGGVYHSDEQDLSYYPAFNGNYNYSLSSYQSAMTTSYSKAKDSMLNILDPNHLYYSDSGSTSKNIYPTHYADSVAHHVDSINYRKLFRGVDPGKFTNPKNDFYLSSKLNVGDFKFEFEYFNRDEGLTPDYNQKYYALNAALQNWQVRQGFISARYDKKLGQRFTLSSFSYYRISDRGKYAELTPYTSYENAGFTANKGVQLDSLAKGVQPYFAPTFKSTQSSQFRTELRGLYNVTDRIDFTGGVEFRNGLLEGDYVNAPVRDPLANGYDHDSASYYSVTDLGIFALASYNNADKKFNINVGGRLDNNVIDGDFGYGSVFNPRLAFIYYPKKFIFKSIYSEAFLDASPFQKFSTTSSRIPNPTLKPEKVRNIELSGKYMISKRSSVEVAYYHSWYSNSLVTNNVGNGVTQFQALGKARVQGVQVSAVTTILFFSIYANATFTDPYAVNTSAEGKDSLTRMGDIATFSANAGVNMRFLRNFNLNMRVNYIGDKPTGINTTTSGNPYTSTPGYTLVNGTFGYMIRKVGVLQCRVDNIFDEVCYASGVRSASGAQSSRVPLPGRVVYVQYFLNLK